MAEAARRKATYDDLYGIPEDTVGEIINGELIVTPRPSRMHGFSAYALGGELLPPYQFGRGGGPGGWIIIGEPEIKFGDNFLVPDIAGWRRERFPHSESTNWISVTPDWITEILSPSTVRVDRIKKMAIFAEHQVSHLWLIDPTAKTLEVFRLESGGWLLKSVFGEDDMVRVEPFTDIEIDLKNLWLE
ncbi:MAG: Uma2 family endonuclease [Desulforhabdus sp.]|jgi:Uma2 family endonuclease|nr:Uma2 family endonuclease [Desulforhabdus sp.]